MNEQQFFGLTRPVELNFLFTLYLIDKLEPPYYWETHVNRSFGHCGSTILLYGSLFADRLVYHGSYLENFSEYQVGLTVES
jgi:hypothetical protein